MLRKRSNVSNRADQETQQRGRLATRSKRHSGAQVSRPQGSRLPWRKQRLRTRRSAIKKTPHQHQCPDNRRTQEGMIKKREREREREKEEDKHTQKELFPASASSAYKTFYTKEHTKGKDPRWKQQKKEPCKPPPLTQQRNTAKKHPTNTEEAEKLSKQLEEQMQEAKQMMTTMHDSMARTGQQPFVQELQQ